jgi:hypothetical protein
MRHKLFALCILAFAIAGMANAQTTASSAENRTLYSQAQLKELARDAHMPEQFSALAAYYDTRQRGYLQQAAEEKQEWIRRSQNIVSIRAKYPRPVDSARYLYEYYTTMANESGRLAASYGRLSGTEPIAQ